VSIASCRQISAHSVPCGYGVVGLDSFISTCNENLVSVESGNIDGILDLFVNSDASTAARNSPSRACHCEGL
jgi:hypothetical protein